MASTKSETALAPHALSASSEDVNYASKLHPDVQRGSASGAEETKPVFDVSALGKVDINASPHRGMTLDSSIAEVDEDSSADEGEGSTDSSEPFVVNGSGDPKQNKYPHPSLGQLAKQDLQGSSEVLTASLIEIRKHPGTLLLPPTRFSIR